MRVLFGTDGIRGKAAQYPLDPPTMFALGEALAHRFRRVIMGMDTRESGPDIARALSAGIVAGGGQARFIGVITTPGVAYLCRMSDAEAGISISASHNPYDDNGV
ncbi:MAG TPA: phosphoglucosamine mutase, partial [Thermoanaerobaculia bacterium]|nr:phosphoglucosamine mutase [Thermoanaerobaculia bacterium]